MRKILKISCLNNPFEIKNVSDKSVSVGEEYQFFFFSKTVFI